MGNCRQGGGGKASICMRWRRGLDQVGGGRDQLSRDSPRPAHFPQALQIHCACT